MNKKIKNNSIIMPKQKNAIIYIILVIGIIFTVILAQIFTTKKVDDIVLSQLNYFETGRVEHEVYYKSDNGFYPTNEPAKTPYITQYIDSIVANFNYYNNYSKKITGYYNYKIVATLKVFEPGNESNIYWSPEYTLTDEEETSFIEESNYHITKNVEIDYQKYLNEYNNYKSKSALATNAKLVVELKIHNGGVAPGLDSIDHDASIFLEIPLSEESIEINKSSTIKEEEQKFQKLEDNQAERVLVLIIAALCWLCAILLTLTLFIVYRFNYLKESVYSRQLKKILNTYDSIIVNVEKLPKLTDFHVVNVTTFDELIDAQMEVRLPINFKENKKKHEAKFVLIKNNLAWVYTLKEGKKK